MGARKKAGKAPTATAPGRARKRKATHGDEQAKTPTSEVPRELAEKKRHVRELAKLGEWEQIRRLYGDKMEKRARAYVEKNGATEPTAEVPVLPWPPQPPTAGKMTPQMIAKQILAKNGYSTVENTTTGSKAVHPATPNVPRVAPSTVGLVDTPCTTVPMQMWRQGTLQPPQQSVPPTPVGTKEAPIAILDSPEKLTDEQKRRIEERRREALQKRKRVVVPVTPTARPENCQVILDSTRLQQQQPERSSRVFPRGNQSAQVPQIAQPGGPPLSRKSTQPFKSSSIEQVMQRELEIAAQITDWDFEPLSPAHPRVVTPPCRLASTSGGPRTGHDNSSIRLSRPIQEPVQPKEMLSNRPMADKNSASAFNAQAPLQNCAARAMSVSQELAAAAEIVLMENEQAAAARKRRQPTKSSASRHADNLSEWSAKHPQKIEAKSARAPVPPTRPAHADEEKSSNQRDATTLESFIAKNFLDDKLDVAVLDFVNMMLA